MKHSILISAVLLGLSSASTSQAATISDTTVGLYEGKELVNEHSTGKTCYLYIDSVAPNSVGNHCYSLTTRSVFSTDRDNQPKDEMIVHSHITNFHRVEFPQTKTCAMNLEGKTSENDIYESETTMLYNQLFSSEFKLNGNQFDYFVTFSPATKLPVRTRLHRMKWSSARTYDCVNLQRL